MIGIHFENLTWPEACLAIVVVLVVSSALGGIGRASAKAIEAVWDRWIDK